MIPITTGIYSSTVDGVVTEHVTEVMLGADWLSQNYAQWNFVDATVSLGDVVHKLNVRPRGEKWCRRVIVQESVTVQPRTQQNVKCRVVFHGRTPESQDEQWETEPSALPSGLLVARTLTPSSQFSDVPIRVMNLDEEPQCLEEGAVVSDLEPVTVMKSVDPDSASCQESQSYVKNPGYPPLPDHMEKLASEVDPSTPKEIVGRLRELMMRYRRVFSESDQDLGLTDVLQHHIDTCLLYTSPSPRD